MWKEKDCYKESLAKVREIDDLIEAYEDLGNIWIMDYP